MERAFLKNYDGPPLRIMEVCGTHTAAIFRHGVRSFLSPKIRLVSGPGCPVCVTVPGYIDRCIEICRTPGFELLCFGDLLKVPGTEMTLSDARGAGGRARMIWSPFDALSLAEHEPETVFAVAAIGFETTAPAFGLLLEEAEARGIRNIKLLTSLKSALVAIDRICAMGEAIDAFLCPGHVSVVTGANAYIPLAEKYGKPFVIAGFEGEHLLAALQAAVEDAAEGRGGVRNFYTEAVSDEGNAKARGIIGRYFDLRDAEWRGLGNIDGSGYYLKEEEHSRDGSFYVRSRTQKEPSLLCSVHSRTQKEPSPCLLSAESCRCGDVILGRIDPDECPLFGGSCTPAHPIGPCMVSSEGACGTWYRG